MMRLPTIPKKPGSTAQGKARLQSKSAPEAAEGRPERPREAGGTPVALYHYVINKGNNSRLILAAMRQRPWFGAAPVDASKKSNRRTFHWEMYGQKRTFGKRRSTCNHLEGNGALVSKKGLHFTMKRHCEGGESEPMTSFMPLSFHLVAGAEAGEEFAAFDQSFASSLREVESRRAQSAPSAKPDDGGDEAGGDDGGGDAQARSRTASDAGEKDAGEKDDTTKRRRRRRRKPTEGDATNCWILKPASFSNRGFGIRVSNDREEMSAIVGSEARSDARCGGWIVQRYIERPLLVRQRKFDVRVFVVLVAAPALRAYVHKSANYVRTSSELYSLAPATLSNRLMHLTNDGVQNTQSDKYGKYEAGNKLSLAALQDSLVERGRCADDWLAAKLLPRIRELVALTAAAARESLNPHGRRGFELLGYDFMLDDDLNVYLIEINSNPCLELVCPMLEETLPKMISDVLKVGLDAVMPPPKPADCSRRQREALDALEATPHDFEEVELPPRRRAATPADGPEDDS
ncbi:tubulin-tyrosine ligase family-domain-containing protein [Pelagophyceae sp. CCMP2097]|nr:tubulin-tyrosine ligase family-domain-containing protein [Pelagophyceae sp. CCMP2097]